MDRKFVQESKQLRSTARVIRALQDRRDWIINQIANQELNPTYEVVKELAEINDALGEAGGPEARYE